MISRRRFLAAAGGASSTLLLGCGSAKSCGETASGAGLGYCLVKPTVLRFVGAARLSVGQMQLFNVDDNSAAIVARDQRGFYALSAICTHSCCVVTLCDASCGNPITNPGECKATATAALISSGSAFVCACHGSEYAADGSVTFGPSTSPLPPIALRRDGDDLLADLSTPASASDRLTV